ncbi:MAG: 5' nucleotidase, NT5C type [Cetobacterium sp.]
MKKEIIIDIDDVMIPTTHELVTLWNADKEDTLSVEDILSWQLNETREGITEYFKKIDFANIKQKNNSAYWTKKIHLLGYEIIVATASCEESFRIKREWVATHLPFVSLESILRIKDKSKVKGFAMIDDGVHNLSAAKVEHKFLYDMPYNRKNNGFMRVRSLEDVFTYLIEL